MALNKNWMMKYHAAGIKTFVESGLYLGETVKNALDVDLFDKIISIELSPSFADSGRRKFSRCSNVEIVEGDSSLMFPAVLSKLAVENRRAMFWLDAHYSSGDTARALKLSSIEDELLALSNHSIKDNVIFIDDMRYMTLKEGHHGIEVERLVELVKSINNDYEIEFIDPYAAHKGILAPQILVASVSK